eukprot:12392253-Karenia_brevis.AAC.1
MHSIHDVIARMYKALDKLRNSDAFKLTQNNADKYITTTPPSFLAAHQGSPLSFKINPNYYNYHYNKSTPMGQGFLTLLRNTKVAPVPVGQVGVTWLELLLLSLAASPNPRATEMRRSATSAVAISTQIA